VLLQVSSTFLTVDIFIPIVISSRPSLELHFSSANFDFPEPWPRCPVCRRLPPPPFSRCKHGRQEIRLSFTFSSFCFSCACRLLLKHLLYVTLFYFPFLVHFLNYSKLFCRPPFMSPARPSLSFNFLSIRSVFDCFLNRFFSISRRRTWSKLRCTSRSIVELYVFLRQTRILNVGYERRLAACRVPSPFLYYLIDPLRLGGGIYHCFFFRSGLLKFRIRRSFFVFSSVPPSVLPYLSRRPRRFSFLFIPINHHGKRREVVFLFFLSASSIILSLRRARSFCFPSSF